MFLAGSSAIALGQQRGTKPAGSRAGCVRWAAFSCKTSARRWICVADLLEYREVVRKRESRRLGLNRLGLNLGIPIILCVKFRLDSGYFPLLVYITQGRYTYFSWIVGSIYEEISTYNAGLFQIAITETVNTEIFFFKVDIPVSL